MSDYNAFLGLNMIHPFTYDAQSERDGLLIAEIFSQRRSKEIRPEDLFPYLKRGVPMWLTDKTVQVAQQLVKRHEMSCSTRGVKPTYDYVRPKIEEELEIELGKSTPCKLKVSQLEELLEGINGKGNTVS